MRPKFYSYLLSLSVIVLFACKSASKSYDAGNYDEAVELAIKKIQKDPHNGEMKALLKNAYRFAVEDREKRIAQLAENNNELKWEWIYNEYVHLQRLGDALLRSPEARSIITPTDYTSYINTYKEKAGDVHVQKGMAFMEKNDKLQFRNAYYAFKNALVYKPGNIEVKELMEDAYEAAILHVAVVTPEQHVGYRYTSHAQREFENDLLRRLQQNINNEFIRFHSTYQSNMQAIDQVMEIYLSRMEIGRSYDEKSTREVSKEVVVKEIVHKKDSVTKEYGKVTAKITTINRTMKSQGSLIVSLRDLDGNRLWNEQVNGDHTWATRLVSYTGDERALSDEDKKLVNKQEARIPQEEDVVEAIYQDMNRELLQRVKSYYNRTY